MTSKVGAVGLALLLVAVGLFSWAPWQDPNPEEAGLSPASQPSTPNVSHETSVFNVTMHASIGAGDLNVLSYRQQVLDDRPVNFTGALVEFTWSTPASPGGLDAGYALAATESTRINETASTEQPVRLWVEASEYPDDPLFVYVGAKGTQERPVSALVAAEGRIHVTTFVDGPPDWSFSAVEG